MLILFSYTDGAGTYTRGQTSPTFKMETDGDMFFYTDGEGAKERCAAAAQATTSAFASFLDGTLSDACTLTTPTSTPTTTALAPCTPGTYRAPAGIDAVRPR